VEHGRWTVAILPSTFHPPPFDENLKHFSVNAMLRSKTKIISKSFEMILNKLIKQIKQARKSPICSSSTVSIVNWKAYLEEKENKDDIKHQRLVATGRCDAEICRVTHKP
jgi:hypothetical protein